MPMQTAERVLALYGETYFDLSMRHFHEKLREEYEIELSSATRGSSRHCKERDWWPGARNAGLIAGIGRGDRYPASCYTSMAASIVGFPTIALTIC